MEVERPRLRQSGRAGPARACQHPVGAGLRRWSRWLDTSREDPMTMRLLLVSALGLAVALPAHAQLDGLFNKLQKKAGQTVERKLEQKTEKNVGSAVDDATTLPKAKDDKSAKPAKDGDATDEKAAAKGKSKGKAKAGPQDGEEAAEGGAPPAGEVYGNRFDFVPGDKVLVYDDFSDTDVGEYPAKWTIKDGGGNQIEVVQVGERRFLKTRYAEQHQPDAATWLRYAVKGDLPKNFTIEFDMDVEGPLAVMFSHRKGFGGQEIHFHARDETSVTSTHATGRLPFKTGIRHVAIAVSGTQAKVYVAGERVLADPDAVERPITKLGIHFSQPYQKEGDHQMFTALRIAEGGKPAKQMLAGEGRIVTHGILFDTGSDVIKPESGPTLRAILALLQEDPALKFAVEGHTDDQGGPKLNGPLSEKRAAAVKAWLVKQGVAADRLTSKGLGQSKPIDSNETLEGRANNRRVEFVKV
jgi:outer membrane protein OmpA-like peptidoglycan-associated protein